MRKLYLTLILVILLASITYSAELVNDMAADMGTDTSSFDGFLSATEDEVQKSLDVLDDIESTIDHANITKANSQDHTDYLLNNANDSGVSLVLTDDTSVPLILNNSTGTQTILDVQDDGVSAFRVLDNNLVTRTNRVSMLDSTAGPGSANAVHISENWSIDTTRNLLSANLYIKEANTSSVQVGTYSLFIESASTGGLYKGFIGKVDLRDDAAVIPEAIGGQFRVIIQNDKVGTYTLAEAIKTQIDAKDGIMIEAFHLYITSSTKDGGGVSQIVNNTGIWIEEQLEGDTNYGIVLGGDIIAGSSTALGAALVLGAGQDASIGYDGTDLVIDANLVGSGGVKILSDTFWEGDGTGVPYAEIYTKDNTTTTTLNSAAKVQITIFDANGVSNSMTPDHTNDHITIVESGVYLVGASVAVLNSAGSAHKINIGLFKNDGTTQFLNVHGHRSLAAGTDIGSITLSGLIDVVVDDTIELWSNTDSGINRNVTFEDVNLSLTMVGGT